MIARLARALCSIAGAMASPSGPKESGYQAGATAAWHAIAGAGVATALHRLIGETDWLAPVSLTAAYLIVKELGMDQAKGGRWPDALADTLFVGLGLFRVSPDVILVLTLIEALRVEIMSPDTASCGKYSATNAKGPDDAASRRQD